MTAPISFFAALAGADPAPAPPQPNDDPAAFAAALVTALQLLQPQAQPVKLPVKLPVVEVETVETVETGETGETDETDETLKDSLAPGRPSDPHGSSVADGSGEAGTVAKAGKAIEAETTPIVIPAEPAQPNTAVIQPPAPAERPNPGTTPSKGVPEKTEPVPAAPATRLESPKKVHRMARQVDAPAEPVLEPSLPQVSPLAPLGSPAPIAAAPAAPVTEALREAPRETPRPSPPPIPFASQETPTEFDRPAQTENARLAARLADLLGELNVTEFKVELARPVKLTLDDPAVAPPEMVLPEPAPALESTITLRTLRPVVESPIPVRPLVGSTKVVALEMQPTTTQPQPGIATGPVTSVEPAIRPEPVIGAEVAADAPAKAPPMPVAPTLPVTRQELPAAETPEPIVRPEVQERPRTSPERSSDSSAAPSVMSPGPAERLIARMDSSSPRPIREARNLPQDYSGNERPAGTADRVTVQVSDAEGRQTRIRVSVIGEQVRAVIVPPDPESARQLERRMDDLQTALTRQGFSGSRVTVQQPGEQELGGAVPVTGLPPRSETRMTSGREQPAGEERQGRGQREQQHQPGSGHRHSHGRSRDQGAEQRRR